MFYIQTVNCNSSVNFLNMQQEYSQFYTELQKKNLVYTKLRAAYLLCNMVNSAKKKKHAKKNESQPDLRQLIQAGML